jgi:UDP-glucuronate decarboxylase
VGDLIEIFIRLMGSSDEITGPINLGNPCEFTILELAKTVIEMTGSKSELKYLPLPSDDPQQRQLNIELAQKALGWDPQIMLKDGLFAQSLISSRCWQSEFCPMLGSQYSYSAIERFKK